MHDAFKEVLTPTWIVSTLIGSVVLTVLSAYLKEGIDRLLSVFSNRATHRITRHREAMKALIARLSTDSKFSRTYRVRRLTDAYISAVLMIFGITMMVTANGVGTHGTGWFLEPTSDEVRVFSTLSAVVMITVAVAFTASCYYRSVMLIRAEDASDPVEASKSTADVKQPPVTTAGIK